MRGLTSSRGQGHLPEKRTETDVGVNEKKEQAGGKHAQQREQHVQSPLLGGSGPRGWVDAEGRCGLR